MNLKQLAGQVAKCDNMRICRGSRHNRDGHLHLEVLLSHGPYRQQWEVEEGQNGWLEATLVLDTNLGKADDAAD